MKRVMISWIPNGLTMGNLCFGFFSMATAAYATAEEDPVQRAAIFFASGILILIAACFDGLDGPVARKLGVSSPLGEQLDSLADLTTFGLAPGFLMFQMYLSDSSASPAWITAPLSLPTGMMIAAIFPICAAFRLARFNVSHDPLVFTGLPSPVAGLFIAMLPILGKREILIPTEGATAIFITMSLLMVSNIKYRKPQAYVKGKFATFKIISFIIIITALFIFVKWHLVLFSVALLYIFSGLIAFFIFILQKIAVRLNPRQVIGKHDA